MKKFSTFLVLWLLWISPSFPAPPKEGAFTVQWTAGKAWFRSPTGKPFLSLGVNAIADASDRAPNGTFYNPVTNQFGGDASAWNKEVFARLRQWHFNTIGSWSDEGLFHQDFPFTVMLYIARGNPWEAVLDSVFSEGFEKRVRENAEKARTYKYDSGLVGYFLDNELPWYGEWGWPGEAQKTLLEKYAAAPQDEANKEALRNFFSDRYSGVIDLFNQVWGTPFTSFDKLLEPLTLTPQSRRQKADADAWAGAVADRYFSVTTRILREVDPNHLVLGVRFAGSAPWEVVEACAKYCDVVSLNIYEKSGNIDRDKLDNFYAKTKKPILITEYSFRAMENQSGDPNSKGADVTVKTQKERAEHFDRFARQLLDLPYIVGLHWFEWADESPLGRFDGEDSNYGLVDIHDIPYKLLTQAQSRLNLEAASLHEKASNPLPTDFKAPPEPTYRKAEPGTQVPGSRNFLDINSSATVTPWGDQAHGGGVKADLSSGWIVADFESGGGWGCGLSCVPNVKPLVAPGVADLRGYNILQFEAFVPKDLKFQVYLTESGAGDPSSPEFKGVNGADGESYSFPAFQGTGKWTVYRVDLMDLERRTSWGNQKGNQVLDLQALSNVDFYIPGGQGDGKILIRNLEFKVK